MSNYEFRNLEREGFCRVCDSIIERGEECFYTYSNRNKGQAIPICMSCIQSVGNDLYIRNMDRYLKSVYK